MIQVVLFTDYDGTISGRAGLCKSALNSIEALRGLGVKVFLASARTLAAMQEALEAVDGAVAENGAVLYYSGASELVNPEASSAIREALAGLKGAMLGEAVVYVPAEVKDVAEQELMRRGIEYSEERAGGSYIFAPKGVNKGSGALALLRAAGVPRPYYMVSVGDDENDLSLFNVSDYSVAVSDNEALRGRASAVTKRHGCAGFAGFASSLLSAVRELSSAGKSF